MFKNHSPQCYQVFLSIGHSSELNISSNSNYRVSFLETKIAPRYQKDYYVRPPTDRKNIYYIDEIQGKANHSRENEFY